MIDAIQSHVTFKQDYEDLVFKELNLCIIESVHNKKLIMNNRLFSEIVHSRLHHTYCTRLVLFKRSLFSHLVLLPSLRAINAYQSQQMPLTMTQPLQHIPHSNSFIDNIDKQQHKIKNHGRYDIIAALPATNTHLSPPLTTLLAQHRSWISHPCIFH